MNKYTNGTDLKLLSDKAYKVIYKNLGYVPVDCEKVCEYTLDELKLKAKEKGIKGYSKMNKETLIEELSKVEGV